MEVERRIHPMYDLWKQCNTHMPNFPKTLDSIFGKYQYIYTSPKGRISLIELTYVRDFPGNASEFPWEICGGGFEDPVRFRTKEDAEAHIKELLD